MSHGTVNSSMHMCEVLDCVLCAVKLDRKASRISVRDHSTFQV